MIEERTLEDLVKKLEQAKIFLTSSDKKPTKRWLKDVDWLIYQTNLDLVQKNFGFSDLVSKSAYEEVLKELEDAQDKIVDLEDALDSVDEDY